MEGYGLINIRANELRRYRVQQRKDCTLLPMVVNTWSRGLPELLWSTDKHDFKD